MYEKQLRELCKFMHGSRSNGNIELKEAIQHNKRVIDRYTPEFYAWCIMRNISQDMRKYNTIDDAQVLVDAAYELCKSYGLHNPNKELMHDVA